MNVGQNNGIIGHESLDYLLSSFNEALSKEDQPLCDNAEYMQLVELHFLIKNIRELTDIQIYQAYSKPDTLTYKKEDMSKEEFAAATVSSKDITPSQKTWIDHQQLATQVKRCDDLLRTIQEYINKRIVLAEQTGMKIPRILRLSRKYGFCKHEEDIFLLMTVMQGSKNNQVLNSLVEEDYFRKVTGFQRLSNMCEVDIDIFCDGDRQHMREGIVLVDEESGAQINLRIQRVAVQLLYGRQVRSDDLLKISQTSLEEIMQQEGTTSVSAKDTPLPLSRQASLSSPTVNTSTTATTLKRKRDVPLLDSLDLGNLSEEVQKEVLRKLRRLQDTLPPQQQALLESVMEGETAEQEDNEEDEEEVDEVEMQTETADSPDLTPSETAATAVSLESPSTTAAALALTSALSKQMPAQGSTTLSPPPSTTQSATDSSSSTLKPYPAEGQLEFLEDCFQMIALMIKGNVARMKDDMKKEGAASRYNSYDSAGDLKHSRRELVAKLRLQENRIQIRLKKTVEVGHPLPRLEIMNQRFQLDPFEKKIILLIIGKTVSPIVKTLMDTLDSNSRLAEDVLTVGQALGILCPDFHTQIAHRRYFYQSGRLLNNAIISLAKSKWHVGSGDMTENRITLDRRILDWVVGLDSEINELVEGSDLYEPVVELSQVVLPLGYAESILSQCRSYDYFQTYRQTIGLDKSISYGNSLVILLCGKSGTGKTMTVNAIAYELKKKVLLVDFNSLTNKKDGGGDLEVDLKGLFRESKMSNTVLFFDECEVIFKSRNLGSERLLNSLLTEIERHEGIVFMATNRPYEIDEAMHRRINMVLEYAPPGYAMRRQIWDNLLGSERVKTTSTAGSTESNGKLINTTTSPQQSSSTPSAAPIPTLGAFPVACPKSCATATLAQPGTHAGLPLAEDVNTSELAVRYELTGGFIKNAVLSALLTALSRNRNAPVVTQADLIAGCKLQMRGNLTQRSFEDRVPTGRSLTELFLSPDHRKQVEKIVRHEQARAKVYGEWSVETPPTSFSTASTTTSATNSATTSATNSATTSTTGLPRVHCEQRASINLFAGTRGSGKNTLAEAISLELGGRRVKYIHASDFMGQNIAEITSVFKVLVHDARIMDAMIIIDGFEHILDDGAEQAGGGSAKLQIMLSRIMDILHAFHGCVCLICHMENPQNIMLQREFATRLFSFLRFTIANHDIRTSLWKALLPPGAVATTPSPTTGSTSVSTATTTTAAVAGKKAEKLNFEQLGRRFELNAGSIRSAIASAVSEAAMRPGSDRTVKQADLVLAGEQELEKLKGGNFDIASKLFT